MTIINSLEIILTEVAMRKVLIVAFLVLLAGTVAAQTVEIGTGLAESNYPLWSGYGYEYSGDFYLSGQIGVTGTILSIAYHHTSGASLAAIPFRIYMKATADDHFITPVWDENKAGSTLVYTGTYNFETPDPGWVTYTLATPFDLAEGQNLLVLVENAPGENGFATGAGGGEQFACTASSGVSRMTYQDNTAPTALSSQDVSADIRLSFGVVPVQLVSFTAAIVSNSVVLNWRTMSETENYGFFIQSKSSADGAYADVPGSFVAGHGTSVEPHNYSWTVPSGDGQWFRLKQVDLDGAIHYSDQVNVTLSGVAENVPVTFGLDQNYPNPFNPTTNIGYRVEGSGSVRLAVYDMLGREVAVLVDEAKAAGRYTIEFNAKSLASGVYTYRLQAGQQVESKRLVVVK
jgi:hypothetical protein